MEGAEHETEGRKRVDRGAKCKDNGQVVVGVTEERRSGGDEHRAVKVKLIEN